MICHVDPWHMAAGSPGCLGVQAPAGHWERIAAAARDPNWSWNVSWFADVGLAIYCIYIYAHICTYIITIISMTIIMTIIIMTIVIFYCDYCVYCNDQWWYYNHSLMSMASRQPPPMATPAHVLRLLPSETPLPRIATSVPRSRETWGKSQEMSGNMGQEMLFDVIWDTCTLRDFMVFRKNESWQVEYVSANLH